mmetsp:Transcript_24250/g.79045  ORF Transcript_24250/g.79045 Transcript_24250/m.79045 type:complete len:369 (+) Transcript_24250:1354-2460(+)
MEAVLLRVTRRHHAGDGADDVPVHEGAEKHAHHHPHALHRRHRRNVTVPNRGHGHHGKVQGGDVHLSVVDARRLSPRLVEARDVLPHPRLFVEHLAAAVLGIELAVEQSELDPVDALPFQVDDERHEARHPVRENQRHAPKLAQLESGVINRNLALDPLEDARRAQDAQELRQPKETDHAQNLELIHSLAVHQDADGVERQDRDEVDPEPRAEVLFGDETLIEDVVAAERVLEPEKKVEKQVVEEAQIDAPVQEKEPVQRRGEERHFVRRHARSEDEQHDGDHVPLLDEAVRSRVNHPPLRARNLNLFILLGWLHLRISLLRVSCIKSPLKNLLRMLRRWRLLTAVTYIRPLFLCSNLIALHTKRCPL